MFTDRNLRLGAFEGLHHEKQLLLEEQKLSRARARKLSLETKQRRQLLEQKRKQWDRQEQQLRENILQLRRQQVQDATERFQRAHLPPSQRRRQSFRRTPPNIEDALNHIQGTLSSYTRPSSSLSRHGSFSRNCTPSPRPPTASKSSHSQALCAMETYTKLLQDQFACVPGQETRKTQEKQQHDSTQDRRPFYRCSSESLSSKDSLEIKEPNHKTKTLPSPYSSFLFDSERPCLDLRKQDDPSSDLTSFRAMTHLNFNLPISRKLHELKRKKEGDLEWFNNDVSKATWGFTSIEKTPETEPLPSRPRRNLFSLYEMIDAQPEQFGVNFTRSKLAPGDAMLESSCPKQGNLLDLRHRRVHDERQLKHPSAKDISLPAKNGNSKDISIGAPHPPNISLDDSVTDNTSPDGPPQQTGTLPSQKEPSASTNSLNKLPNSLLRTEKPPASLQQQTCVSSVQTDAPMCLECPEESVSKLCVSNVAAHPVCKVRIIPGILKKQSRHISGDAACVYGSGHLTFAKEVAFAIGDSVEMTRAKVKKVDNKNVVKKKLRWFDEVHVAREDKQESTVKQMNGRLSSLTNSEDHRLSPTRVSGAHGPDPGMTPSVSPGYHFTKQAWADVGVQVSLPWEHVDEVKVPQYSTRTGGPKVPLRECSARVGAGTVSSRIRKGIVMRPQSAIKVSQIAKTQGRMMVPHPPPRMEATEEKPAYTIRFPYDMDHAGVSCKKALDAEDALHKDKSEGHLPPDAHQAIRADRGIAHTPSEASARGKPSFRHQESHGCIRRRGTVHDEKGLCLDCTPTDDEISQLWHGVRSALATKDEKNTLRSQDLESGRVRKKACVEHSRQPNGSRNKRPPQSSPAAEPVRSNSSCDMASPDEGLKTAAQFPQAEVHSAPPEEKVTAAAMETVQTQKPGTVRQRQWQELTSISLEEQKILLSLDRLNHQLQRVRQHVGSTADSPSTREMKARRHHQSRASPVNNCTRFHKYVA